MKISRATLETCSLATDTVVVIDVLRAFTTTAYAFVAGVKAIILVSSVEEAFALKRENPELLLLGEKDGLPIDGFNFSNSPVELIGVKLDGLTLVQRTSAGTQGDGLTLVQRTSAGTQGVVKSRRAKRVLVTGLCNASATVRYLERFDLGELCLVETGVNELGHGVEDTVCGDLLEALVLSRSVDWTELVRRVRQAPASRKFLDENLRAFPLGDLECAVKVDRFDFAMEVKREGKQLVLHKVVF